MKLAHLPQRIHTSHDDAALDHILMMACTTAQEALVVAVQSHQSDATKSFIDGLRLRVGPSKCARCSFVPDCLFPSRYCTAMLFRRDIYMVRKRIDRKSDCASYTLILPSPPSRSSMRKPLIVPSTATPVTATQIRLPPRMFRSTLSANREVKPPGPMTPARHDIT